MQSTFPVRLRAASFGVLPLLIVAVLGCDDSRIRTYSVPKEAASTGRPVASDALGAPSGDAVPVWQLPSGWQEMPGSGMRFATIVMGEEEDAPQIRVTPLGSMAGEPLANVNRWLDQLGQPPIEARDLGKVMRTVSVGDHMADLIHLEGLQDDGSTQQILAAILPVEERVWFFMAQGDRKDLSPRADAFDRFVQSVRMEFPPAMGMPPDHPPVTSSPPASSPGPTLSAPPSGAPLATSSSGGPGELAWKLPRGWVELENSSSMRLATFRAGSGSRTAEVTITRFPGDVGGELANVNRWRRQVSLAPVASMADQDKSDIALASGMGTYLDLTGTSSRMLVVFAPHGGFTWFLKMSGDADVLDGEKTNFESFVHSVSLPGASG
jgi:hypothetical protein